MLFNVINCEEWMVGAIKESGKHVFLNEFHFLIVESSEIKSSTDKNLTIEVTYIIDSNKDKNDINNLIKVNYTQYRSNTEAYIEDSNWENNFYPITGLDNPGSIIQNTEETSNLYFIFLSYPLSEHEWSYPHNQEIKSVVMYDVNNNEVSKPYMYDDKITSLKAIDKCNYLNDLNYTYDRNSVYQVLRYSSKGVDFPDGLDNLFIMFFAGKESLCVAVLSTTIKTTQKQVSQNWLMCDYFIEDEKTKVDGCCNYTYDKKCETVKVLDSYKYNRDMVCSYEVTNKNTNENNRKLNYTELMHLKMSILINELTNTMFFQNTIMFEIIPAFTQNMDKQVDTQYIECLNILSDIGSYWEKYHKCPMLLYNEKKDGCVSLQPEMLEKYSRLCSIYTTKNKLEDFNETDLVTINSMFEDNSYIEKTTIEVTDPNKCYGIRGKVFDKLPDGSCKGYVCNDKLVKTREECKTSQCNIDTEGCIVPRNVDAESVLGKKPKELSTVYQSVFKIYDIEKDECDKLNGIMGNEFKKTDDEFECLSQFVGCRGMTDIRIKNCPNQGLIENIYLFGRIEPESTDVFLIEDREVGTYVVEYNSTKIDESISPLEYYSPYKFVTFAQEIMSLNYYILDSAQQSSIMFITQCYAGHNENFNNPFDDHDLQVKYLDETEYENVLSIKLKSYDETKGNLIQHLNNKNKGNQVTFISMLDYSDSISSIILGVNDGNEIEITNGKVISVTKLFDNNSKVDEYFYLQIPIYEKFKRAGDVLLGYIVGDGIEYEDIKMTKSGEKIYIGIEYTNSIDNTMKTNYPYIDLIAFNKNNLTDKEMLFLRCLETNSDENANTFSLSENYILCEVNETDANRIKGKYIFPIIRNERYIEIDEESEETGLEAWEIVLIVFACIIIVIAIIVLIVVLIMYRRNRNRRLFKEYGLSQLSILGGRWEEME